MLLIGGFGILDTQIHEWISNPIPAALIFFGILGFASDIIGLPFSIYKTFVIENKFGFNRTSISTFIKDKLKGYILGIILGGSIFSLLIWIYLHTGVYFWLLAWAVTGTFLLLATMFYTSWILPMFNKLSPLPPGDLRSAIESYSKKVSFDLTDIFIMDGSKRSSKANAFFSGFGKSKKIVLFDTLLEKHTTEELVAVLAHEIGHYKLKHTRTGFFLAFIQSGIMFYILSLFLGNPALANAMHANASSFEIDILAFGLLYSPLSSILGIIMNIVSRRNEFQADDYARTTFNGVPLSSALKKLSSDSLSNLNPHPAYVFVHYSHPPLLQRLRALMK